MNLARLLRDNREKYGTYTSLIYEGTEYTNEYHDNESSKWAHALATLGVSKGDRVMVMMPNRPEVFWSYSAIVKMGAIVVPVMPLLQTDEVRFIVEDAAPVVILTSNLLLPRVEQAVEHLAHPPVILSVDDTSESGIYSRSAPQPTDPPLVDIDDDDTCVILYTSGTTGRPKGVELSHRNLYANANAAAELAQDYELNEPHRVGLCILPLSHAFGFTVMNSSIILGQRDVLLPYFDPVKVFEAVQTYRVTHFSAVPAMFHAMLVHPDADKYDLSSLTLCISGSAPMSVHEIEAFTKRFGAQIYEGYGLSEAAPIVTAPRFNKPPKPGSVGLPLPGVEVKVVDDLGNSLPPGAVGELIVRGPNVTKGYHKLPEQTAEILRDGWLYTGDMARLDDEGYVYIVDRKKDVIIRGGFNIYPRDLEELLMQHRAVSEVAVVGVPSEEMGEEVVAYVVKAPKQEVSSETLMLYCQEHLAKYKTPREIRFVSYLPKNVIGKVDKKALRNTARTERNAASS